MDDRATPEAIDVDSQLSDAISSSGPEIETIEVSLSNEIVHLLSEQLYTSPLKAIEELVANAYDADADECRIALILDQILEDVPVGEVDAAGDDSSDDEDDEDDDVHPEVEDDAGPTDASAPSGVIAIFDDGTGMNVKGLRDLWRIGDSPKRGVAGQKTSRGRLIIGKFGIGKLATYAIAHRITYLTAHSGEVHEVVCDFREFGSDPSGAAKPVKLSVKRIDDLDALLQRPDFTSVINKLGVDVKKLKEPNAHWTLCILDNLKPKARQLKIGRLSWVLRTAMPLKIDFAVFLNETKQESAKEKIPTVVDFSVGDLEDVRLQSFNDIHKVNITKSSGGLVDEQLFPNGIRGSVSVSEKSLVGKADRLIGRSNGFFVRVRERLVNAEDKLFHNTPLSFETFNRFRAEIEIDDLHEDVTAPREGIEMGRRRSVATALARELFNQARDRFTAWQKKVTDPKLQPEHVRSYVAPRLVERPVADALAMYGGEAGVEADKGWFYMNPMQDDALSGVVEKLYSDRTGYEYKYSGLGDSERLTKFDPSAASFTVNDDHELVRAFSDEPRSRELLDIIATSEVMLEVYLKEAGVASFVIAEVLERRDLLLRSLAQDRVYSLETIATSLRNNFDNDHQLELALVAAARAVGFNAKHISGSGKADGIARFLDSSMTETTISLEAKSSQGIPTLGQLDLAGVKRHRDELDAAGVLMIAPVYPGQSDPKSAVAVSAIDHRISCWTVEQLARVVEASETRQITARQIAGIVTTAFAPLDVAKAVDDLLAELTDMKGLYKAIMNVLREMFSRQTQRGDQRKVPQIAALLSIEPEFHDITESDVKRALLDLSHASRGAMSLSDDIILFFADFDEVTRRVYSLTGELGEPRGLGTFRVRRPD
ncbi:MAG: hypothetical protein EOQ52_06875 [Mesorhizobium sp.]|uniref:ATP-binding protein n=1 Tax=Mesorhizobium sp. TaxID=1871066 RepID=UPI000FE94EE8|nr:ATP-binding protein [Mesorhizobium sp.]RWB91145.1 MAG: hypothetical protein EOQ52_06875 [Mesorhizobium sp.]